MSDDPARRYPTAAAVANELKAYLERRPTSVDRSRALRFWLWCRRNPQLALTALLVIVLATLTVISRATRVRLRAERNALRHEVEQQELEQGRLATSMGQARAQLAETHRKLAVERQNLTTLEGTLAEERTSYGALLQAKEKALGNATAATRHLVDQLDKARRQQRAQDDSIAALERDLSEARRESERIAKDRDRLRREREAARAERDLAQRERDRAIQEREQAERRLRARSPPVREPRSAQ